MSHHCLHHLWGSATSTWATQHPRGTGIPWDGQNPMGSGCFAGHAGTCLPAERANKLLSHSKTMKAKPQSPKVPLSHSPAAATAPQPSQNLPPPAAADPCSKGAGKRFPAGKASLSGHRHGRGSREDANTNLAAPTHIFFPVTSPGFFIVI